MRPDFSLAPPPSCHKRDGSDVSGDNDQVTAIAWSLVGLMAASLGVLSAALYSGLGARIDALGQEMRADIRDLRDTVHALDVRLTRTDG